METFETRFMAASAQDASSDLHATAGVLSEAFGMDAGSISHGDLQEVSSVRTGHVAARIFIIIIFCEMVILQGLACFSRRPWREQVLWGNQGV